MRALLLFVLLWLVGGRADAQDTYERTIDDAVAAFERGEWSQAHALFERAHAVAPNARSLRGLGMTDFNLHLYARATAELEGALQHQVQPLDDELRAQVETLLERTQPYVARLRLQLMPANAQLSVDYAPPLRDAEQRVLVDLGPHTLRLEAPAHAPYVQALMVRVGGEMRLALTMAPPAVSKPRARYGRWLVLASGVAALGVGVGTRVGANQRFDALERSCRARAGCLHGDVDMGPTRRLERASYATLGIGSALTVAAFVWWLLQPTESP